MRLAIVGMYVLLVPQNIWLSVQFMKYGVSVTNEKISAAFETLNKESGGGHVNAR